ncbi:MAG: YgjV family protein [Chloroflexota bacterium]|nr:YgjV family protein [Chloroflexota bacterium]
MGWLDVLGWAGSALLIYSLMQARVLRFRLLNLVACIVLVVFNGLLGIWPMVAMNVVLSGINLWFIRKLASERHNAAAFEVLEVGPHDAYLRHTLRVHADDIAKFQPGLVWEATGPGRTAYLVQRGDETVGMVLVRDAGDGVAQVELDYVTPRFRDFSPGEFVYRRSGLFRDRGFRKVVTPAGMVAPYYDRLGFHRDGESYVLDLS